MEGSRTKGFPSSEETLQRSDDCPQMSDGHELVGKPCLMRKIARLWGCWVVDGATCAVSVALRAWGVVGRGSGWGSHLPFIGSIVSVVFPPLCIWFPCFSVLSGLMKVPSS